MKYSKQFILLLVLSFSHLVFADESRVDAEYWSQKYGIIMAIAPSQRISIYQDIWRGGNNLEQGFMDLLAESYASSETSGKAASQAKALLFEILVTNQNAQRYLTVLVSKSRPYGKAKLGRKLDRLVRKAKKVGLVEQYKIGSIDVENLRNQYAENAITVQADFNKSRIPLSTLPRKSSIQDMFNRLGTPQHMISGAQRFTDGVISVNIRRLNYYYRGQGRVVFDYKKRKGWNLHSVVLDPIAFEEVMPYRRSSKAFNVMSDYDLHMSMLLSDGPISIRRVAEIYNAESENAKIEMFDVAAEKLITHFEDSEEASFLDAYAWLCKWLARRGGPRYAEILKVVENNSDNAKLVKYAKTKIDKQRDIPEDIYQSGSVSLANFKKKYPSPYIK